MTSAPGDPGTDEIHPSAAHALYALDPAAEAWRAFDPPDGHPRLWCDQPAYDARPPTGNQLLVSGWAMSRTEGGRVSVRVEFGRTMQAAHGFHRFDVSSALPEEPQALRSGWLARFTTQGFFPGVRRLRVVARDEQGRETSVNRVVEVDPGRPYCAWLASRRPPRRPARKPGSGPRFFVCVRESTGQDASIDTALSSLEGQSQPAWRLVTASADAVTGRLLEFVHSEADYFVLSDAEATLEPHALLSLARAATADAPPTSSMPMRTDSTPRDGESTPSSSPHGRPSCCSRWTTWGPSSASAGRPSSGRSRSTSNRSAAHTSCCCDWWTTT